MTFKKLVLLTIALLCSTSPKPLTALSPRHHYGLGAAASFAIAGGLLTRQKIRTDLQQLLRNPKRFFATKRDAASYAAALAVLAAGAAGVGLTAASLAHSTTPPTPAATPNISSTEKKPSIEDIRKMIDAAESEITHPHPEPDFAFPTPAPDDEKEEQLTTKKTAGKQKAIQKALQSQSRASKAARQNNFEQALQEITLAAGIFGSLAKTESNDEEKERLKVLLSEAQTLKKSYKQQYQAQEQFSAGVGLHRLPPANTLPNPWSDRLATDLPTIPRQQNNLVMPAVTILPAPPRTSDDEHQPSALI